MTESTPNCTCVTSDDGTNGGRTIGYNHNGERFKDPKTGLYVGQSLLHVVREDDNRFYVREEKIVSVLNSLVRTNPQLTVLNEEKATLHIYIDRDPLSHIEDDEKDLISDVIRKAEKFLIKNGLARKWTFDGDDVYGRILRNEGCGVDCEPACEKVYRATPGEIMSMKCTVIDDSMTFSIERYAQWKITITLKHIEDTDEVGSDTEYAPDHDLIGQSKKCKKRSIGSISHSKPPGTKRVKK